MKAKVYFTRTITPEKVLEMYRMLGCTLPGKVAVKLHSGEVGNQNFLRPEFWKPVIEAVNGTVVECNTAYEGQRDSTEKHKKTMEKHGWSRYFTVDILDAEGPDLELEIPNGKVIRKNYVGKDIRNYDSMLVLSHFKGHAIAGCGGAIKNISIGIAGAEGKTHIHTGGQGGSMWSADQDAFLESMAEAGKSVVDALDGNILYVNVMNRLSVDCDCDSSPAEPDMHDIGILASFDPVALDQACFDLVYAAEVGESLVNRIESRNGLHTLEHAEAIGLGSRTYELVSID